MKTASTHPFSDSDSPLSFGLKWSFAGFLLMLSLLAGCSVFDKEVPRFNTVIGPKRAPVNNPNSVPVQTEAPAPQQSSAPQSSYAPSGNQIMQQQSSAPRMQQSAPVPAVSAQPQAPATSQAPSSPMASPVMSAAPAAPKTPDEMTPYDQYPYSEPSMWDSFTDSIAFWEDDAPTAASAPAPATAAMASAPRAAMPQSPHAGQVNTGRQVPEENQSLMQNQAQLELPAAAPITRQDMPGFDAYPPLGTTPAAPARNSAMASQQKINALQQEGQRLEMERQQMLQRAQRAVDGQNNAPMAASPSPQMQQQAAGNSMGMILPPPPKPAAPVRKMTQAPAAAPAPMAAPAPVPTMPAPQIAPAYDEYVDYGRGAMPAEDAPIQLRPPQPDPQMQAAPQQQQAYVPPYVPPSRSLPDGPVGVQTAPPVHQDYAPGTAMDSAPIRLKPPSGMQLRDDFLPDSRYATRGSTRRYSY